MIIEELNTYDLTDEELDEGIEALNEIFDSLSAWKSDIEDINIYYDRDEAEEIGDKLFDIVDVPYLSDVIDNIISIINRLEEPNITTKTVRKVIYNVQLQVISVLRELENEKKIRI